VTEKLEKLTALAKQRSLFDDATQEINRLTYVIKMDLQTLDADISQLQDFATKQRGSGSALSQASKNSDAIVKNLESKVAATTKSFLDVLNVRTQTLKEQNYRRKHFESASQKHFRTRKANPFSSLLNENGHVDGIQQQGKSAPKRQTENDAALGDDESQDHMSNGVLRRRGGLHTQTYTPIADEQEMAMAVEEPDQDQYLASRNAAVQQIEVTMVEISKMYQRLLEILATQDEHLIGIDHDTSQALEHVDSGHKEILKYFESMSSGRWLVLKIFGVLIFFLFFFFIFVA